MSALYSVWDIVSPLTIDFDQGTSTDVENL
jgi:hypothetical protein